MDSDSDLDDRRESEQRGPTYASKRGGTRGEMRWAANRYGSNPKGKTPKIVIGSKFSRASSGIFVS